MNLEARVDKLEQDVSAIRSDVSAIKERLNHMPTKYEMVKWALGIGIATVLTLGGMMIKGFGWW